MLWIFKPGLGAGKLPGDKSFYNWTMMNVVKKQTAVRVARSGQSEIRNIGNATLVQLQYGISTRRLRAYSKPSELLTPVYIWSYIMYWDIVRAQNLLSVMADCGVIWVWSLFYTNVCLYYNVLCKYVCILNFRYTRGLQSQFG